MSGTESSSNTTPSQTQAAVAERIRRRTKKAVAKKNQVLKQLKIEYVPINSVRPNEYNPNRQSEHDFELLLRSIEEDGFTQPVIVNLENTIVDGEHRWRAATTLGMTEIPVVRTDMTPEQARIATLRHNRARGSEDVELTAQLLRDLQELGAMDWAADSLMLDDAEIQKLLEDVPAPEALAAADWSDAWNPDSATPSAGSVESRQVRMAAGSEMIGAGTHDTASLMREREARLKQAKTEQERSMIQKDTSVTVLSLTYTAEQIKLVQEILGKRPAEMLLHICSRLKTAPADVKTSITE